MSKKTTPPRVKEKAEDDIRDDIQSGPGPSDRTIFICASKFSKAFSLQAAHDFNAGKVKEAGQILLPDGQIIAAGPTYETIMSSDLIQMVKSGVLQASTFGKMKGLRRGNDIWQKSQISGPSST